MNPVNIIYIVLYLISIQPSHVKSTLKQYIYFILLHYFIKWFIRVQNAYLNMSVNESSEHNLYCVIFEKYSAISR